MEDLATKIRDADAFVFVVGEYNWGVQPGLKNLTDHFLEEWFWRPAAIASYSGGRLSGARSNVSWHGILSEMGIVVISRTLAVGPIGESLTQMAHRWAMSVKFWSVLFRGSRMTLLGGPMLPKPNALAALRPIDSERVSLGSAPKRALTRRVRT